MSHILVLNGSARLDAFTAAMIRSFCEGAESAGHTVRVIDLCKLNIHSCIGCLNGGKDKTVDIRQQRLVQEPEEPQGDSASPPDFDAVQCEIAVRQVLDLLERFSFPSYFEKMSSVDNAVTARREGCRIANRKLVVEEHLAERSLVRRRSERTHQVRVVAE